MLKTPKSQLTFIKVLSDLFGLAVEFGVADSARITIPPPADEASVSYTVPNVIEVYDAGVKAADYELREAEAKVEYPL